MRYIDPSGRGTQGYGGPGHDDDGLDEMPGGNVSGPGDFSPNDKNDKSLEDKGGAGIILAKWEKEQKKNKRKKLSRIYKTKT